MSKLFSLRWSRVVSAMLYPIDGVALAATKAERTQAAAELTAEALHREAFGQNGQRQQLLRAAGGRRTSGLCHRQVASGPGAVPKPLGEGGGPAQRTAARNADCRLPACSRAVPCDGGGPNGVGQLVRQPRTAGAGASGAPDASRDVQPDHAKAPAAGFPPSRRRLGQRRRNP